MKRKSILVVWLWQYEMDDTFMVLIENIHGAKYGINNRNEFLINGFGYVYTENPDSLTSQKFCIYKPEILKYIKNR